MTDSINLIIEFHHVKYHIVVVPVFPVLPPLELSIALIYAMNALRLMGNKGMTCHVQNVKSHIILNSTYHLNT